MGNPASAPRRYRFGTLELDARTGELFRDGRKTQLRDQPLQLLLALLEHPGELVTREELTRRLWPADTFVDFDRGLNKAVNKVREALGDSADQPQFIETLPRKGYRFIGKVGSHVRQEGTTEKVIPIPVRIPAKSDWKWRYLALGLGVAVLILGVVGVEIARDLFTKGLRPADLQIHSLAVLPLENLSRDPEQTYFVDGMTDALITEVARAGTMRVISRTTILRYKGTRQTTHQIGRELGVDAIVEGSILRAGNKVRITARLIQVLTDKHLWAQSYERDMTEVLRLQQEVARDIARQVGRVLQPVEPIRTVNPEAYGEYLRGRFYFFQYTPSGWKEAIEHYNQASQADPSFAPAFAGLAESYVVSWAWNALPSDDGLSKGRVAAQKALQLDPMLASAHLAMGEIYVQEWDHASAEKELRRALELNPNDPLAWQLHGIHRLWQGHYDEGIAEQERARSLDPLSPIINANLARAFCYSREYDKAIAQAQETLTLEPGYSVALVWLEHAYRHKGMLKLALDAHLTAAEADERPRIEQAYRSAGYRGVLVLQAEADKKSGNLSKAARGYAQAGDKEQALTLLEECYRRHCPGLGRMKVDPDFDPINSNPRYKALLKGIGYGE